MTSEPSFLSFIVTAGPIVKFVMLILLAASVASWTMIFQRWVYLNSMENYTKKFEERFWAGVDLGKLYQELDKRRDNLIGIEHIYYAAFNEYFRLNKKVGIGVEVVMEGIERSMRVALAREMDALEKHLSFLATVGSVSPYIGLFGTVWGIMTSFQSLSGVSSATIAMVAPGISEALIATAMGLFAAIPAVIAYNRYANKVERISNHYATFQEELASILHRSCCEGGYADKERQNPS
jgi:biopolymer transport protein TolQ